MPTAVLVTGPTGPSRASAAGGEAGRAEDRTSRESIGKTVFGIRLAARYGSCRLIDENSRGKVQNVCRNSSAVLVMEAAQDSLRPCCLIYLTSLRANQLLQ